MLLEARAHWRIDAEVSSGSRIRFGVGAETFEHLDELLATLDR